MPRAWFWNGMLVAWLVGIALQLQQAALWQGQGDRYAYLAAVAVIVLIAAQAGFWRKTPQNTPNIFVANARQLAVLLACLALGFASTGWRATQRLAQQLPAPLVQADVQVQGRILGLPQQQGGDGRFDLAVEQARYQGQAVVLPPRLQLAWYARSHLPPLPAEGLQAGQVWAFTLRLKPLHGNANPHGFDYELWAFERGLRAGGYVRAAQLLTPAATGWAAYAPQHWGSTLSHWRAASRDAVFARVADGRQAAVLAALLMGEQSVIERSDWDLFRATGVAHLMSISGLHITLFAWLAALALGAAWRCSLRLLQLWPAQYAASLGGLVLAVGYAAFTGWGVPAQRTALMLALATLLRLSGRRWPWHFALLLVAAVVLALDPWALLQAGFWLSFVAVGVLLLQNPSGPAPVEQIPETEATTETTTETKTKQVAKARAVQRLGIAGQRLLREQIVISLALAPLSMLLFGQFSLVGLLANLLAIPLVTFVITPLVLLGLVFHPLWALAAWVLQGLLAFLDWCAAWPYAVLHTAALPWGLGAAAVAAVLLYLTLRQQQAAVVWRRCSLAVVLLLCAAAWRYQPARPAPGQFQALFVDVGQGNAVLIQTSRHSLLYDTGPRYSIAGDSGDSGDSSGSNAGARVLLPLLRALALQPDALIVSHADSDHSGGAAPILQQLPPKVFYTSMAAQPDWPQAPAPQPCVAGQHWRWDGVDFDILHPQAGDYGLAQKSNAMSCVLRISHGQHSVLLAGDLPQDQERNLWQQLGAEKLASTVLLAPHHGSKTSSNLLFLQAVQPRWVVVQAGYLNPYHHPAPEVLQRYADLGLAVRGSTECGAMTWDSAQPDAWGCLRRDAPRYWWHQLEVASPFLQVKSAD